MLFVLCFAPDDEDNRFAGEDFPWNLGCEAWEFRTSTSASRYAGDGVSNDESTPDDPVSTDMDGLSVDDGELLCRNITGLLADAAGTAALDFLAPFPAGNFFSGLALGWSGEGGCTTTCEFSHATLS